MSFLAIFKRVAPFVLTFAVGLFIASFFVTVASPNFNGFKRNPSKYREFKRMKGDIEEMRREKYRLKEEIEALKKEKSSIEIFGIDTNAVPPPPPAPHDHRGSGTGFGSGNGK
jgi:hypothetical protein